MYTVICAFDKEEVVKWKNRISRVAKKADVELILDVYTSVEAICFDAEDIASKVDLLYIDMDFPGAGGLRVAEQFRKAEFAGEIVFVATSDRYAVAGYDFGILNYMIKKQTPISRFDDVFMSAVERKELRDQDVIILSCAGETRCVPIQEIRYFKIDSRIITVFYRDRTFEFYSTMKTLEKKLQDRGFERMHKSFLVNELYVKKVTMRGVYLRNGEILPAGRKYISARYGRK